MVPSVSGLISKYTPAEVEEDMCIFVQELFSYLNSQDIKPELGGEFFVNISYVDKETVMAKRMVHDMAQQSKRDN